MICGHCEQTIDQHDTGAWYHVAPMGKECGKYIDPVQTCEHMHEIVTRDFYMACDYCPKCGEKL